MKKPETNSYELIAKAIDFVSLNQESTPHADEIAETLGLSNSQLLSLFADWANTTPKKFFSNISREKIKPLLKSSEENLFDSDFEEGIMGTGRLHDQFIEIEVMSASETRNNCENLRIKYSLAVSHYGKTLIGSTSKGVCYLGFADDEEAAMGDLQKFFPKAEYTMIIDEIHQSALKALLPGAKGETKIKLHLKGTKFQILVWEALLKIPAGMIASYSDIAKHIRHPKANRAVGTAVGFNPVSFLVPCHRVIPSTGHIGKYMWGSTRKAAMLGYEISTII